MEITFGNNYKASMIENEWEGTKVARLYDPNDVYLAGTHCTEESFKIVAEALMDGYFAGWRDCRSAIKASVLKAVNIDFDYSAYIKDEKK